MFDCCEADKIVSVDVAGEEHVDEGIEDNFREIDAEGKGKHDRFYGVTVLFLETELEILIEFAELLEIDVFVEEPFDVDAFLEQEYFDLLDDYVHWDYCHDESEELVSGQHPVLLLNIGYFLISFE